MNLSQQALCQKEALCHQEMTGTTDDRQPGSHHAAPRGADWTGMLGGTSRPTNPEYELNGK